MSSPTPPPQNTIRTLDEVIALKGEEWRAFFTFAQAEVEHQFLNTRNLVRLSKGNATVKQATMLIELLKKDSIERPMGGSGIEMFFRRVDFSNYNLTSWLDALSFFNDWLKTNHKKTTFSKMLGFIECCEQSPEDQEKDYRLVELVKEMLENEGFIE